MKENTISVITVCYNCCEQLEKTILSYISQSYKNKELIVVDGGSHDNTLCIIKKYEDYITKWISEPDNGIYDAMNKGLKLSSGEWVNFMNAGDVFANCDVLSNIFSQHIPENISFLYSDVYEQTGVGDKAILRNANRNQGMVNHQSSIYKKSLHQTYGMYQYKRPYKVYDLMFFLSIPAEYFQKVQYPISINDNTGVSNVNTWCFEQAQGLRVAYGIISIHKAYKRFWFQKINSLLPNRIKYLIDIILRRNKF